MSDRRPVSLVVTVLGLVALGGILYYGIDRLSTDIGPGADDPGASSALYDAATAGDTAAIQRELQRGAAVDQPSPSAISRDELTPLMAACAAGKTEAARALLAGGAKPNARSKGGKTALMYAALFADAATVRALLDAGAHYDARSDDQWTPLMFAANRGDPGAMTALLAAGANVDARNRWGQTALMAATRSGDAVKVQALLAAGANPNLQDNAGETALSIAAAGGDDVPLQVVEAILAAKPDLRLANAEGVTPLMRAADRGDQAKVIALLNAGAPADAKDQNGWTALDWSRARGDDLGLNAAAVLERAVK